MSTLAEAIDRTTQSFTGGGIGWLLPEGSLAPPETAGSKSKWDPDNSVRQNVNILPR
jgi:hypothetical protein